MCERRNVNFTSPVMPTHAGETHDQPACAKSEIQHRLLQCVFCRQEMEAQQECRERLAGVLEWLDSQADAEGPFFLGRQASGTATCIEACAMAGRFCMRNEFAAFPSLCWLVSGHQDAMHLAKDVGRCIACRSSG